MTHVPEPRDGEVLLPDDGSENPGLGESNGIDEAPDLPEIPEALDPNEIRDGLDESAPNPIQNLDSDGETEDRSAWRKPSWLRFRSRFGL